MTRKVIGTHSGAFHCDEVLAIAMLKQLPEYKDADIIRTRDMKKLSTCNIVVDVGAVFDAASHRYDHHQPSFDLTMKDFHPHLKPVVKLSSAGLIYAHFGKRVISEIVGKLHSDADLETLFKQQSFSKALDLVTNELLGSVRYLAEVWLPAKTIVAKCFKSRFSVHPSGMIMRLTPTGCPWKEHFFELEKEMRLDKDVTHDKEHLPFSKRPVFLVTDRTNDFSVTAIPIALEQPFSKRSRQRLPSKLLVLTVVSSELLPGTGLFAFVAFVSPCLDKRKVIQKEARKDLQVVCRDLLFPCGRFFALLVIGPCLRLIIQHRPDSIALQPIYTQRSFSRVPLPLSWAGKREHELDKAVGSSGCVFVHSNRFLGIHKTLDGALEMAKLALKAAGYL
ncbi:unnamed protein product [Schistocephalus solidus]|uniref:UPF0160 protein MYG1, mitochondrial n=1 Tax=Schistocephalus solidus TaxID=70667 RepID=A0A183TA97_SCHSO|nr:unnamed protein product [Schistocephalus solidus]